MSVENDMISNSLSELIKHSPDEILLDVCPNLKDLLVGGLALLQVSDKRREAYAISDHCAIRISTETSQSGQRKHAAGPTRTHPQHPHVRYTLA